ncbi:MAG TPA: porin family protein [Chryseosolibacter sp.]|nr:porin family protein [Chryseosolibacter sp.]
MKAVRCFTLIFLAYACTSLYAWAQDDCELTISEANTEFQAGHFYNIPAILDKCRGSFTADQSQRAHLLLTQTYLLLDDPIGARNSYLEVLRANPEFIADISIHPADVVYLSKSFTATPIFAWSVRAGSNVSMPRIIHDLSAFGESRVVEDYQIRAGYQVAAGGDFYLNKNYGIRAELGYSFNSYKHQSKGFFSSDTKTFIENMGWLSLPVSVMYTDHLGRYRPYGYAGYAFSYLLRDKAQIESIRVTDSEGGSKEDKKSPDIDFLEKRNRVNTSVIIGGGIKAKYGLQFFFVDVRYAFGLKNLTRIDNIYANNEDDGTSPEYLESSTPATLYGHVDDLFRLDNLSISVGLIQPLYNPREIKRNRINRFLNRR